MKNFTQLIILFLLLSVSGYAQTTKKTTTPVKKTAVKKPAAPQNSEAKAAAIAKAKQDSIAAVNALAMKIARQIIAEDSIKKARIAEQIASDEKAKQEQLLAEKNRKPEKSVKTKSGKKETVKTAEPVKNISEEPKPVATPTQTTDAKIFIGLRATGIAAFVVGKDIPDYTKPYFGYGGGLVANFALGKHFSFQPEVLYAQEGFSLKGEEDGIKIDAAFKLSGIQVPLLIKYSFGESNKGFFINAGPYGTYLLNSMIHDKTPGGEKVTVKPEKTTIEYGVAAGFGVAVPMGKGRLLIEARGNYYLGATGEELDLTDAAFVTGTVSVGYLFPIGR